MHVITLQAWGALRVKRINTPDSFGSKPPRTQFALPAKSGDKSSKYWNGGET
jgi:hypothetical protein